MNRYFTTRAIPRPWQIGDTRTVVYCENNKTGMEAVCKQFPDAMPVTRAYALSLVRWERYLFRSWYENCPEYHHSAYVYPYWWDMGQAIDATDSTGCIVIR